MRLLKEIQDKKDQAIRMQNNQQTEFQSSTIKQIPMSTTDGDEDEEDGAEADKKQEEPEKKVDSKTEVKKDKKKKKKKNKKGLSDFMDAPSDTKDFLAFKEKDEEVAVVEEAAEEKQSVKI